VITLEVTGSNHIHSQAVEKCRPSKVVGVIPVIEVILKTADIFAFGMLMIEYFTRRKSPGALCVALTLACMYHEGEMAREANE